MKPTHTWQLLNVLVLVVTFLLCSPTLNGVHASDLTIDFSYVVGPAERHATGFEWIFPMSSAVYPYVSQLKPNSIKDPWGNEQTARDMGAHKIQWLVGNAVVTKNGVGTHWYPWQDYTVWQQWVTDRINSLTQNGQPHEWIIWQEANHGNPDVWSGGQGDFFNTWKIAVQAIRSIKPNDPIVGPSPVPFDEAYLDAFLLYAKANNVLPDVLSWHELYDIGSNPAYGVTNYTPDLIPSHVATMKQFMQANGININKFDITEYQGYSDNYRPGPTVAFIADMERAPNVSGTKGNWADANQLEGLVTDPNAPQPRSIWWVYKRYADMTGNIVTTMLASVINGFGSYDAGTQTAMVLAGNQGGAGAKTIQLNNIPAGIISGGQVAVTLEQIPDTERAALTAPIVISQGDQPITGGSITVSIPSFGTWDAYVITVKRVAGAPPLSPTPTPSPTPKPSPTPTPIKTPTPTLIAVKPGDLNGDGKVDIFDYNIVVADFGKTGAPGFSPADINRDGKVNIFDYNILIGNFGK